jgi:hypothetical protein
MDVKETIRLLGIQLGILPVKRGMIMLKKFSGFITILILGFFVLPLQAQQKLPYGLTDAELAVLPSYCHAKLRGDAETKKLWNQRMGMENFVHLHHFCHGLKFMNRAKFTFDKRQRNYNLQQAIGEFGYVLKRWPTNFPLTMEAQNHKMQAEMMLKQP